MAGFPALVLGLAACAAALAPPMPRPRPNLNRGGRPPAKGPHQPGDGWVQEEFATPAQPAQPPAWIQAGGEQPGSGPPVPPSVPAAPREPQAAPTPPSAPAAPQAPFAWWANKPPGGVSQGAMQGGWAGSGQRVPATPQQFRYPFNPWSKTQVVVPDGAPQVAAPGGAPISEEGSEPGSIDHRGLETDDDDAADDDVDNGEPACDEDEVIVLRPLMALTAAMQGKLTSNETQIPTETPQECHNALTKAQLMECYYNWGLTKQVSECYADSKLLSWSTCGKRCGTLFHKGGAPNTKDIECLKCEAAVQKIRRICTYKAAGLTRSCIKCQTKAYAFWDIHCMMKCNDAFTKVKLNDPLTQCRACNDIVYQATARCSV